MDTSHNEIDKSWCKWRYFQRVTCHDPGACRLMSMFFCVDITLGATLALCCTTITLTCSERGKDSTTHGPKRQVFCLTYAEHQPQQTQQEWTNNCIYIYISVYSWTTKQFQKSPKLTTNSFNHQTVVTWHKLLLNNSPETSHCSTCPRASGCPSQGGSGSSSQHASGLMGKEGPAPRRKRLKTWQPNGQIYHIFKNL